MMTSDDSLDCLPHQQPIQRFEEEVLSLSSCFMTSDGLLSAFDDLLIASSSGAFPLELSRARPCRCRPPRSPAERDELPHAGGHTRG